MSTFHTCSIKVIHDSFGVGYVTAYEEVFERLEMPEGKVRGIKVREELELMTSAEQDTLPLPSSLTLTRPHGETAPVTVWAVYDDLTGDPYRMYFATVAWEERSKTFYKERGGV